MAKEKPIKVKNPKPEKKAKPIKPEKVPKPPKSYSLLLLRIQRIAIYSIALILIGRGVVAFAQGDRTIGLKTDIETVATVLQNKIALNTEASAFAQNFVKEYLTYENRDVEDYKKRLSRYCNSRLVTEIAENAILVDKSNAQYVQTLSISRYSANQYDITVSADVVYTKKKMIEKFTAAANAQTSEKSQVEVIEEKKSKLFFIVPVWFSGSGECVIEDTPRLTAPVKPIAYNRQEFTGTMADENEKVFATQMLNDFLKSLFEEPQNKIDYYLSEDADRAKFEALSLGDNMSFGGVEDLALYKTNTSNEFIGFVSIKVLDANGTKYHQRFNITLYKKDKFYAKDINLRTHNIVME